MQIRAELVDDASLRERRPLQIETLVMRELLGIAAVRIDGPKIHGAIAIAREIDAAVPPHGVFAGSGEIGGEGNRFRACGKLPEILRGAALVALRFAALERTAGEEQRAAIGIVDALRG